MRKLFLSALLGVAATLVFAGGASAGLNPGGPPSLSEQVPVNFVFVGYEPGQVSQAEFLSMLPAEYHPVVRSRQPYGIVEELGIEYTYDYNVVFANTAYENRFFAKLNSLATPAPRTVWQDNYNAQVNNVLDVGDNHFIDAPSVEKWLAANAPAGVDTRRNTVYFINWYGRPDFKFHVYTKIGEPDPDTGFDFGLNASTRKIIAWGGTAPDDEETGTGGATVRRVWFYDLSAGPESWTDNWNVDDPDLDGDGVEDYRMPPVWEYLANGYRDLAELDNDLGRVGRYVFLNLLATSSPLYPPYLTFPRQPESINIDLNTFEGWEGVDASEELRDPVLLQKETVELLRNRVSVDNQDYPLEGKAKECAVAFNLALLGEPVDVCYPEFDGIYPAFASLFLFGALNIDEWQDGGGEYEAIGLSFSFGEDIADLQVLLGLADDNWIDGTQSFTYNFVGPAVEGLYGLTTTEIHEFGHHWGMSHPHDGFDWEDGIDYGPGGPFYYAWSGDESNTMMSYIDVNWDFSQFDRDNYGRFGASAYILSANAIAADIEASPNAFLAAEELAAADRAIDASERQFTAHNYVGAFDSARQAYRQVRSGARDAGVPVEASTSGWEIIGPAATLTTKKVKKLSAYAGDRHPAAIRKRLTR